MGSQMLNPMNKKENLRLLRRRLGLTQKDFIGRFLSDEEGVPSMSVATLSNLESRGGPRLNDVILMAADALQIDSMLFSMKPEEFIQRIDILLPGGQDVDDIRSNAVKKGKIDQLLYRLTMYFAERLIDKELKKGDKIESDRVLAKKMNVGRSAIREALKVLDVLGMIDIHPGQGTFISNDEASFFIIPLSWSLFLNGGQVEEILTVRNLLEVKAAELSAGCRDAGGLERLGDISRQMKQSYEKKNQKEFLEYDIQFHGCIAECSGNQVIFSMIQTINSLMRHITDTGMADSLQLKELYQEHQKIYGRIIERDSSGAAEAMKEHLERSAARYYNR